MTDSAWSNRRVLVTGATGMVGSWLCRRLVDEGALAVALVLDDDPQSELSRSGTVDQVTVVSGSLDDFGTVERAINGHEIDTVVHLGAQTIVGTAHRSPRATFETNVAGTWNVLEACRAHTDLVRRVAIASSDKAYGEHTTLPYTEAMRLDARYPYEVSKACADLVAQSYAHTYGTPVAIARCGNIYGPGDLNWSRIVPGTIRSLLRGEQPIIRSDGTFLRDYLHVDDVVDAFLLLADRSADDGVKGEAFNFSDESPRTVMEIYAAVCKAMGAGEVEPRVLDAAVGEIKDQYLDATKARTVLGWSARVALDDGLARTVAWYRELLAGAA
jgi:CDP-glucose 4,6-dehydratase